MKTHVEFRSSLFPPMEGEAELINPGRLGKRLAEFLYCGLTDQGFAPGDPIAEDWGWIIPVPIEGFRMWIGCGNYEEYPSDGFLCFIEPAKPVVRRWIFWTIDISANIAALQQALDRMLSGNPGIRDVQWSSHEEFLDAPPPNQL